ncbi:LLM class flavin-dependent oxidoreductase [Cryptosporangium arvum]|uniref:Flavin-dependent oxidoreductase, F420-dependent methylene-tetrahydromethanopterin reductase n=1 Tax=Cryptosporangium arvum DSM 44712 TaxID=927661 RepID=A0A010Z1X7_9ACTN|nr:flavin-dependent oxidoreductase, F420-dependent methylene-tetrahydromethanopterin reductase [Cryptosporangium arvum DSM 44712]
MVRNVSAPLHLAVAFDGAGWHPAAWREPEARPADLLSAGYWVDLAAEAEAGRLDFLTIEDAVGLQTSDFDRQDDRVDQVRGRLDAVLIASRVAPRTRHVGLVPTATVTHTEPFHLSKAIATLDYVSRGRAGLRVQVSARAHEADHFGRRQIPRLRVEDLRSDRLADLFDEAADYVEVLRRLWDSWEDDAEIRDAATGRFVDRDKLHYINFEGRFFDVKGPSITPRPPQGQPLVTALAHATIPYRLGARSSDVVYVTPHDVEEARTILAEVRAEQEAAGRSGETVHVFADLVVFLDGRDRKARLDEQAGEEYRSDALIFTGSPAELADLLLEWQAAGLSGFRLRPGVLPTDLEAITRGLVPELQQRGVFRRAYEADTLRGLLGLSRPANRYARAES